MPQMLEIVARGVRRASCFMALGLRASADDSVTSVTLDANCQMHFMPVDLPIDQVREVQQNFRPWVIGNALRELDQVTSIFADSVFRARTLVEFQGQAVTQEANDQISNFKNRTNVAGKLQLIAERFGIDTDFRVHMPSLSKTRNALSHNMGIVGERHCTQDRDLQLSWIGFELAIGDRALAGDFEPFRVEEGEVIEARFPVRTRTIPINTPIELSPHDLNEICYTYLVQSQKLIQEFESQLREMGIVFNNPPPE